MTILRYTIRHKIYVRHSISFAYATEILLTTHNLQQFSVKRPQQKIFDTSDVTSGFLDIEKRNKFSNMAAPMAMIVLPLKLLIIKHRNIC